MPPDVLKWGRILEIGDTALVKLALRHIKPPDPLAGVGCVVTWRHNYRNHRLHLIQFHEGDQLIVCVPAKGQLKFWTPDDEECLRTEAQTMRYIEQKTTVPVAHVYGFDTGFDNEIGAPYILLQRLNGDLMCDAWHSVDPATDLTLEEKRDNMCRTLAEAMSGLHALSFPSIGRLDFGDSGSSLQISPKVSASHHRSRSGNTRGRLSDLKPNGEITRRLPCRSSRTYFRSALANRPAHRNSSNPAGPSYIAIGALHVLGLVLDYVPRCEPDPLFTAPTAADKRMSWNSTTSWQMPKEKTPETFVLAHPSGLAPQNLFFNDMGHLVGIVDWAGVTVVPRCIGYAALPVWLRRQWGEEEVSLISSDGATQPWYPGGEVNDNDPFGLWMSRQEEERRRRLYTNAMRTALQRASGAAGTQEENDARFTSQSLVYCAVESALRGDGDGEAIAKKILRLVLPDCEPWEMLMALGEKNQDARDVDERIRRGLGEWFAGQDEAWDDIEH
ncbi:hypothetical protein K490DRAFT_62299 [Saccharata proteae CBS 121410]|uniref:Aminoglycoside phosphotransferase domain-containing protein n=1 Tax=Saccharata proteae CBS 121410 TaxID=1314787 RepID=A0A9P4I0S2_9PEZI|nr:hypothetical protein K490DRAFT_62299 [Saccharata proteae CBS 121410]